jgi:hypothetical protein
MPVTQRPGHDVGVGDVLRRVRRPGEHAAAEIEAHGQQAERQQPEDGAAFPRHQPAQRRRHLAAVQFGDSEPHDTQQTQQHEEQVHGADLDAGGNRGGVEIPEAEQAEARGQDGERGQGHVLQHDEDDDEQRRGYGDHRRGDRRLRM